MPLSPGPRLVQQLSVVPGPAPAAGPWPDIAAGAVALAVAAALATVRVRRTPASPRRAHRILAAAAMFAFALATMVTGGEAFLAATGRWNAPPIPELGLFLVMRFGGFALLGGLLIGTADLLIDALRPWRTRIWLAAAPAMLAAFVLGVLAATGWQGNIVAGRELSPAMLAAAAAAAAIIWWSFLPRPGDAVARIFH